MKNKYNVNMITEYHYNDGRSQMNTTFIGTTYAVSDKKAIAQVKYREGIYNSDLGEYYIRDGYKKVRMEAVLLND